MLISVQKILVENFRNLKSIPIEFGPYINVIFGDNGNGKTNILEAIYFLLTRKSFRKNTHFPQMLSYDNELALVTFQSVLNCSDGIESLSIKLKKDESEVFINGKNEKKNKYNNVIFIGPYDAIPFFLKSSERRDQFDLLISSFNNNYKKTLTKYYSALKFRNILLQNKPYKYLDQIYAINIQLAVFAQVIVGERQKYIDKLNKLLNGIYKELFSENSNLKIEYSSTLQNGSTEELKRKYDESIENDEKKLKTTLGPHRDDYVIYFNNYNAYEFCSLGQQKMAYLAILFSHLDLQESLSQIAPIILIDDISGEFDSSRWSNLVNFLTKRKQQIVITTANNSFKNALNAIPDAKSVSVSFGEIYTV